ncbi:MAG: AMP-binding protein [Crocinitomicaceae bacterium]
MSAKQHIAFDDIVNSLDQHKDRVAMVDKDGTSYTYAQFKTYITGARAELVKRGVKKGSKVLVFVPMTMELYAILEALFSLGATAIFLDPWMKGKKMGAVIKQVQPDLYIVTRRINLIARLIPATWGLNKWKLKGIQPNNDSWKITEVSDDDNALITFTSGTSGSPKGANRTFGFLHAQAATLKSHLKGETTEGFVDYTNFPIVGLADFAVGNTLVIPQINLMKIHKADVTKLKQHLIKQKVNRVIVSPSLLSRIVDGFERSDSMAEIKHVVTGGAPISNQLINTCLNQFREIEFEAIYGSTEAEPICLSDFKEISSKFDAPLKGVFVGTPIEEIEFEIVDFVNRPIEGEEFDQLKLTAGNIGEVVVTGKHVNKNYYENPAAFKKHKIIDGNGQIWHRTGDIGYRLNNQVFLVGRDHRIYQHENKNIYPYPIEQYLEKKLGCTDVGYIQKEKQFICYVGQSSLSSDVVKQAILEVNYPVDEVVISSKALPRDARHKSKLQVEDL